MYAVPRKKRKSTTIEKSSILFSKFIEDQDYKSASLVVLWCVLEEFAKEGILDAIDNVNSFIETKELRRGL